jgi:hypothetical protein
MFHRCRPAFGLRWALSVGWTHAPDQFPCVGVVRTLGDTSYRAEETRHGRGPDPGPFDRGPR